jgi:(p)ppGpp synthase/HD superfamily hydrolase
LLHDTIEDTGATHAELVDRFGVPIADGVRALSRRPTLPKREQFADSLRRIQVQPTEVWMVKLAERITSLASPPRTWSRESFERDRQEAIIVADALGQASAELDGRLRDCIASYPRSL